VYSRVFIPMQDKTFRVCELVACPLIENSFDPIVRRHELFGFARVHTYWRAVIEFVAPRDYSHFLAGREVFMRPRDRGLR